MARKVYNGVEYDTDIDYSIEVDKALKAGDIEYARALNKTRNAKNEGEGLGYAPIYIPDTVVKSASKGASLNPYLKQIASKKFNYDPNKDPLYAAYKKQNEESAGLIAEDVLGSYASMTGGIPSSYAVSAAGDAVSRHRKQADDKMIDLYQLAYDKFSDEKNDLYKQFELESYLDERDYNRAFNEESRDYDRFWSENDRNYERTQYEDEKAYSRAEDKEEDDIRDREEQRAIEEIAKSDKNTALNQAITLAQNGIPIDDSIMEATGLGMTGEDFLNYYRDNAEYFEKLQYKYAPKSNTVKKEDNPKELKIPTASMYDSIDKQFSSNGEGFDGLRKYFDKYDWDEYNIWSAIKYVHNHYSTEEGYDDFIYESFGISVDELEEYLNS